MTRTRFRIRVVTSGKNCWLQLISMKVGSWTLSSLTPAWAPAATLTENEDAATLFADRQRAEFVKTIFEFTVFTAPDCLMSLEKVEVAEEE